jgi:hypothetical protein
MARPATPRRKADHRTSRLDRPSRRHDSLNPKPPAAAGSGPAAAGSRLPATPVPSIEEEAASVVKPDSFWALLPPAERERFGLRLSRLVLKAARTLEPNSEEDE